MKNLIGALVSFAALYPGVVFAQDKTVYACVETASAGLKWGNNSWKTMTFLSDAKFILTFSDNSATTKGLPLIEFEKDITTCEHGKSLADVIECHDSDLGYLVFSTATKLGAITYLMGSVSTRENRDTPMITTFSCDQF